MKTLKKMAVIAAGASMMFAALNVQQVMAGEEGYTEISFWNSMDTSYAEILQDQIDRFNSTIGEEKKIKVTSVFQSYPGTEALTAAMSSDDVENMPDVIQLYSESISLVRGYERTVWAEDMMDDASSVKKEDLIPNVCRSFMIDDRLIGMPYNVASYVLYYNKDQLAQAGFDAPPATLDEMAQMLPVLVEKTDADYGLNVRINMNEMIVFVEAQGSGGSLFGDNNNGHSGYLTKLQCVEDGTLKNFIDGWQKIIDTGAYKAVRDSINEEFALGMHSMVIMSSSRLKTIEELVDGEFEWGIAPVPVVNEQDCGGTFPTGSGLFMLNRGDQAKVDAAWEFVQYMASPQIQAEWVQTTGYVPVNVNALENDVYKESVAADPKVAVPYDVMVSSAEQMTSPFVPNYGELDTLIKDTMISFADGNLNADEAYNAIAEGADTIFEEYYRTNPIE